jgi:hypothetical protein
LLKQRPGQMSKFRHLRESLIFRFEIPEEDLRFTVISMGCESAPKVIKY